MYTSTHIIKNYCTHHWTCFGGR